MLLVQSGGHAADGFALEGSKGVASVLRHWQEHTAGYVPVEYA